jgi:undecaprenyl diphosphate synthase
VARVTQFVASSLPLNEFPGLSLEAQRLPRHVAIVMDGNGRWARQHGLSRPEGHRRGKDSVRAVVEAACEIGIPYLTLFVFSNENWQRPGPEVRFLMELFHRYLSTETKRLMKRDIKVVALGDLERLPPPVRRALDSMIAATAANRSMTVALALSYGGRQDVTAAARRIAEDVAAGRLRPDEVDEHALADRLPSPALPTPTCSSAPRVNFGYRTFSCSSSPTLNFISPTHYGPISASASFCRRSRPTSSASVASARSTPAPPTTACVLRTRVWTALVALPAVLAVVLFAPAPWFAAFVGVLTVWGLYEVGAMTQVRAAGAAGALVVAGGGSALLVASAPERLWFVPLGVILAMLTLVVRIGRGTTSAAAPSPGIGFTLLGALYVGALFPYFALLRNRPGGVAVMVLILLLVIASDTGAYFIGSWMGRTKLAPNVSPKKTVEGAIGGLALCVVAGLLFRAPLVPGWSLAQTVVLSAAIAVLAQLGDLAGSALKRRAGVKDSGWIFPGHGGLLDRTCSMVFATVFTYYWSR